MSAVQIIDDSDSIVTYSSGWQKSGGSNEYNATTTWANQPGSTATVVFVGVQIAVVGTIGPRSVGFVSPQSNYSVDGSPPNVYSAVQDGSIHYNTRYYLSPTLSDGQHTLLVTNLLDSDSFFIDYFLVYKSPTDTSFNPKVVTVTLTSPVASQTGSSAKSGSSSSNTGTIVGSAFGAAALIVVAVAFILWLRRRKKRMSDILIDSSYRDDRESVPVFAQTQSPNDTFRSSPQPVHAFASTSSDVAQPTPQTQNSAPDALPPPPRYTYDGAQPLIIPGQGNNPTGNPIASKFNTLTLSSTPRNSG